MGQYKAPETIICIRMSPCYNSRSFDKAEHRDAKHLKQNVTK
jgi:hypothetical protein